MQFWNQLTNTARLVLVTMGTVILLASGVLLFPKFTDSKSNALPEIVLPDKPTHVTIYITGLVNTPGVYTLAQGSRIQDAIRKAGGPRKGWDQDNINLAKKLSDEDMITVTQRAAPTLPETQGDPSEVKDNLSLEKKKKISPNQKISVNKASLADWENLPGVGPSMAKKILNYRKNHGQFRSVMDLKKISGLGGKKFNRIQPYLHL